MRRILLLCRTAVVLSLAAVFLAACAALDPDYETPAVTLSSFKALPSESMLPAFEIGLRIINPNAADLDVQGIVYTVALQGHELVKGVGKGFPVIEGYSEGVVTLTASANLLAGIQFVTELMRQPHESLDYRFRAKLDLGGFQPTIRIDEGGKINLAGDSPQAR
jgi:LEA14-like dessication related protein